jgi:uncharacterized membrane protein YfcA
MIDSLGQTQDKWIVSASTGRSVAIASKDIDGVDWLAIARRRRAEYLKTLIARWFSWNPPPRILLFSGAAALGGAALAVASSALPSWGGMAAPALAIAAVVLASTLSSIAGFAFSAVCGAMLLHLMNDPVQVVVVMMICSIAIQSLSVVMLWRDVDWRKLLPLLAGGVVGLPVGVWLLLHLGNVWFKEAAGGLLIAYAAYGLLKRPLTIKADSGLLDACVGCLGGITGGLAGFPGAAVTIWCSMKGWDKRRQRATYQPFILIMQVLALLLIQFMGSSVTPGAGVTAIELLLFVPAALLGTWFGLVIFRRLSDRVFALVVNLLLLVSGIGLLV